MNWGMIDHIISIVMFWCPDECYLAFWLLILNNCVGEVLKSLSSNKNRGEIRLWAQCLCAKLPGGKSPP